MDFVAALPLVLFAVLRSLPAPRAIGAIALVWGLVVIPVYALLGVDWLWAHLTSWRPDPLGSLVLGALLVAGRPGSICGPGGCAGRRRFRSLGPSGPYSSWCWCRRSGSGSRGG